MDIDINYYRAIQGSFGFNTKKEIEIAKMKVFIKKHFKDSSAVEEEVYFADRIQSLLVMKNKDDYDTKKILAYPNESFSIGEIFECYGHYWIIDTSDVNEQIYTIGKAKLCPFILKWQGNDGRIHSSPYYIDSLSSNIQENKTLDTSGSSMKIVLPFNDYTREFYIDKRFMGELFNDIPQCWKITDLNSLTKRGLLVITLERDEFNSEKDSVELGICNYIKNTDDTNKLTIQYNGTKDIRIGDKSKEFIAVIRNSLGDIIEGAVFLWEINIDEDVAEYITFITDNNKCYISLDNELSLLDKAITLQVSCNELSAQIELRIGGLI